MNAEHATGIAPRSANSGSARRPTRVLPLFPTPPSDQCALDPRIHRPTSRRRSVFARTCSIDNTGSTHASFRSRVRTANDVMRICSDSLFTLFVHSGVRESDRRKAFPQRTPRDPRCSPTLTVCSLVRAFRCRRRFDSKCKLQIPHGGRGNLMMMVKRMTLLSLQRTIFF